MCKTYRLLQTWTSKNSALIVFKLSIFGIFFPNTWIFPFWLIVSPCEQGFISYLACTRRRKNYTTSSRKINHFLFLPRFLPDKIQTPPSTGQTSSSFMQIYFVRSFILFFTCKYMYNLTFQPLGLSRNLNRKRNEKFKDLMEARITGWKCCSKVCSNALIHSSLEKNIFSSSNPQHSSFHLISMLNYTLLHLLFNKFSVSNFVS